MPNETGTHSDDHEAQDAAAAIDLCLAAHQRLFAEVDRLGDDTARRPSLLPGWSVGHVLTHVARNADGHVRRLGTPAVPRSGRTRSRPALPAPPASWPPT